MGVRVVRAHVAQGCGPENTVQHGVRGGFCRALRRLTLGLRRRVLWEEGHGPAVLPLHVTNGPQ